MVLLTRQIIRQGTQRIHNAVGIQAVALGNLATALGDEAISGQLAEMARDTRLAEIKALDNILRAEFFIVSEQFENPQASIIAERIQASQQFGTAER